MPIVNPSHILNDKAVITVVLFYVFIIVTWKLIKMLEVFFDINKYPTLHFLTLNLTRETIILKFLL